MSKKLVAYFSVGGVTANAAKMLAEAAGADLYEIKPAVSYTNQDLDWTDKNSRSSMEMNDPASRPVIGGSLSNMTDYGLIFLGFPIWWYTAPTIIKTFLESYDFRGKTIVPFATSGGSGMGETARTLQALCPDAAVIEGKLLNGKQNKKTLTAWIESLSL